MSRDLLARAVEEPEAVAVPPGRATETVGASTGPLRRAALDLGRALAVRRGEVGRLAGGCDEDGALSPELEPPQAARARRAQGQEQCERGAGAEHGGKGYGRRAHAE